MSARSAVIDTNVLVAALWGGRTCRALLEALEAKTFELSISPPLLAELNEVVTRSKFRHKIAPVSVDRLHHVLSRCATLVHPVERITLMSDPDDDRVLECVAAASPMVLITGDGALLALKTFRSTSIVTPAAFLATLRTR